LRNAGGNAFACDGEGRRLGCCGDGRVKPSLSNAGMLPLKVEVSIPFPL